MTSQFEIKAAQFKLWRDEMISGIETYKSWLDSSSHADIQQSLRIYDLIESLRSDRMTLAFLAEFSRGKTELINAMFFSDFQQRLLPSNIGRTTMCPTEIFFDPGEEPYLRLLPIETRTRQETVSALKRQTVEWIKIRLNVESRDEMIAAMKNLAEAKTVSKEEAIRLGLWDDANPAVSANVPGNEDRIEIPAWRHALINYPHRLLKSGLVVIDTPGLNALGTEPELTLSMLPNAQAVLYLLAMDTGVTKSDMDVWQKYVQPVATRRIVVLNKIDLMWDDLKSEPEIAKDVERQIETTAELLGMPRTHVLGISAQKALVARIRGDDALLARSCIEQLEHLLASEIIPAKQDILRVTVQREIGSMISASRLTVASQLTANRTELSDLAAITGKNRNLAQAMVQRLEADRKNYQASVQAFQSTYTTVMNQGAALLQQLSDDAIAQILAKDREFIEGAWTTAGLWKNMQLLFQYFTGVSNKILSYVNQIKSLVDTSYNTFHEKFGFEKLSPPALNMEQHTLIMVGLQETARQFCHDPINVMTAKKFLVQKFYDNLVGEARQVFESTRSDVDEWLKSALNPLNLQIKTHEQVLAKRIENFKKIRDNIGTTEQRITELERQRVTLQQQSQVLTMIKAGLEGDSYTDPHATMRFIATQVT